VPSDPLHFLLTNVWSWFMILLFFGGSIFVHELGHYLAARYRGIHVEVFSIGFGPPIVSFRGKDGTRYQIAWFPIGGYVLLPQIADLGPVEGTPEIEASQLPPASYVSKVIVLLSGAAFNILFAFLLACVIWIIGQPENDESMSTTIGYVTRTTELPDGSKVVSPAAEAGLRVGDVVKSIDGHRVTDWADLSQTLSTSAGRDASGNPKSDFVIERDGQTLNVLLHPRLVGEDRWRRIGIAPGHNLDVHAVAPNTLASRAGLLAGDRIVKIGGAPIMNESGLVEELLAEPTHPATLTVLRAGHLVGLTVGPRVPADAPLGLEFQFGYRLIHPSPFTQIVDQLSSTLRNLRVILNPRSDVGLSKMSGPVGIVHIFSEAAEAGIRYVLMITILVNVSFAVLNLLPIPVLDGGQIVFATIAQLRGRALPFKFIAATQSVFFVLLLSMILYVSIYDVRRWARDAREERALATPPAPTAAKP
jgi:regulator of sigma E protease